MTLDTDPAGGFRTKDAGAFWFGSDARPDAVVMDTDGNLDCDGDVTVAGDVTVTGTLTAPTTAIERALRPPSDYGAAGWTFAPTAVQSGSQDSYASVGQAYIARVTVAKAQELSAVSFYIGTAPSGEPSDAYVGLYDASGTRVAVSADAGSAWNITGLKTTSFTAAYDAAAGEYYIGVLVGTLASGTTMPALLQGTPGGALTGLTNFNLSGADLLFANHGSSLTALPASFTPADDLSEQNRAIWLALT